MHVSVDDEAAKIGIFVVAAQNDIIFAAYVIVGWIVNASYKTRTQQSGGISIYVLEKEVRCHLWVMGSQSQFALKFYLLLFIQIYHNFRCAWSLPFSSNAHLQNIRTQKVLLRKCQECFNAGIAKKLRKFQCWG